jgi:catechol 2,3-dioxygenase
MAVREHETTGSAPRFFRPRRVGHANLYIGELERSMDFYKNVVGLREAYRRPPIQAGFLNNGNTHHDIGMVAITGPTARNKQPGLNHLAWELENQVDLVEGHRRSTAAGVQYDRTINHEISHSLYFKDTDGNLNEIYADTKMRWYNDRSGDVRTPTLSWTPGDIPPDPEPNYEIDPECVRVEGAVFQPLKITHNCLVVAGYERAFDFYTGKIGLDPVIGGRDSAYCALGGACGMRDLSLFRARPDRAAQLHHMGFVCWSEAELEASIERARKQGIPLEADIDHPSRRSIVALDPDGLRVQFYVDRTDTVPDLSGADEELAIYLV